MHHPIVTDVAGAAAELVRLLEEYDRAHDAGELEPEQLAFLAASSEIAVRAGRSIGDQARHALGNAMPGTSGRWGPIVATRGYDTQRVGWDHEGLLHATLIALGLDDDTRAVLLDRFPAGSFGWRVGKAADKRKPDDAPGLRDLDLEPDEWCETQRRGKVAALKYDEQHVLDAVILGVEHDEEEAG